MAETVSAKVCVHCGQDCSKKARTKDAQGRYACKECHEAAVARAARGPAIPAKPIEVKRPAVPAAPPSRPAVRAQTEEEPGVLSELLTQVKTVACTACGAPMEPGAVFCTRCGVNTKTGQRIGTRVEKAPKEPKAKTRRGPSPLLDPMWSGLGALAVLGGVAALGMSNTDALPFAAAILLLYTLVFGIWMLIDAFQNSVVSGLLYIFLPFYALYYGLAKCEHAFLKTHWAIGVVAGIVVRVMPWQDLTSA